MRAVLLAGEGESFSAGADVDWMRSSIELSYEENVADARRLRKMLEDDRLLPGAGRGARARAMRSAAAAGSSPARTSWSPRPTRQFAFSEVKLGIIPAVISPYALAKIGASAARRYFVTGERFDAATALRIGLVHEVAADLDAAVDRQITAILRAGPQATRAEKLVTRERPSDASERANRRRTRAGTRARRACAPSSRSAAELVALSRFSDLQLG